MPVYRLNDAVNNIIHGENDLFRIYHGLELVWQKFITLLKGFSGYPVQVTDSIGDLIVDYNIHGNTKQFRIPQEYVELEFVSSSGTQYINTGIKSAKFVHDIAFTNGDRSLMGTSVRAADYWGSTNGGQSYEMGRQYAPASTSVRRTVIYDNRKATETTLIANGMTLTSWITLSDQTYSLFKISDSEYYSSAVLYGFQAYDTNDNLVANYIPAKRRIDNVVGFYDTVSGEFKENEGTGRFFGQYEAVPTIKNPLPLYSVGDAFYDDSELENEGSVYVTDDGLASNFSSLNFVRSTLFDARRPFDVTYKGLVFDNITSNVSFGALVTPSSTKHLEFILNGNEGKVIITDGYHNIDVRTNLTDVSNEFDVEIHYDMLRYTINIIENGVVKNSVSEYASVLTSYTPAEVSFIRIGSFSAHVSYPNTYDLLGFSLKSNGEYISKPKKYLIPIVFTKGTDSSTVNILVSETLNKVGEVVDTLDFKNQVIIRRTKEIERYSGEEVTTEFASTTGTLTEGAHVIYVRKEVDIEREEVFLPSVGSFEGSVTYTTGTFIKPSLMYIELDIEANP